MFSSVASKIARRVVTTNGIFASSVSRRTMAGFPAPKLFDYDTVTSNLSVADAIESVEAAFSALAKGKVSLQ